MIPILAGVLGTLAQNGLGILANAITAKGKDFIEEKLGVEIPDEASKLTPELLAKLKEAEMLHEEFLINADLEKRKLELEAVKIDNTNTSDARDMNKVIQSSEHASELAKNAAYYLDFIIVGSTLILGSFLFFFDIPVANKELLYMAFGSLLSLCGTVVNFHRGTSASSRNKDEAINKAIGGMSNVPSN